MLIQAGFTIGFECTAPTPMLLQLNIHPSRSADLLTADRITSNPPVPMRSYVDLFGNTVTRLEATVGLTTFQNLFTIADCGELDETPLTNTRGAAIAELPDDALLYLLSSRYCDSDNLADFAWSQFGGLAAGLSARQGDLRLRPPPYPLQLPDARPTRSASEAMREGIGVCRDYAHLAIALCRCMNVPARYCTGYLGDIGVPIDVNPMDFSGWAEVFLDGRWYTLDARHNHPRIGRILMGRGRDAADVAMSTAFGVARLARFEVVTDEVRR